MCTMRVLFANHDICQFVITSLSSLGLFTRRNDEPATALNAAAREEEGGEGERLKKEILRR